MSSLNVSSKLPAPKSGFSRFYRLLFMMALLSGIVVFIFPIVLGPGVELSTEVPLRSPLSIAVRISNQNPFTPLTDVEYGCEVSKLTLATGAQITDANVLTRKTIRKLEGRRATIAPCETAYVVNAPISAAEYKMTLTYRAYPWPQRHSSVHRISAQMDQNGNVTRWTLN